MGKVLFITNTSSALFLGMKEQLEEMRHVINILPADMNEIHNVSEKTDAILIYLDEKILNDSKILVYIRDMAVEKDMGIFLIGYKEYFESVRKIIPNHIIRKEFYRPIDVKNIVQEVSEFVSNREIISKKKILVVDDSGTMLRNIKAWLESKYQVILANSGTMAIKYLAKEIPDLILLDYEMPVCDGKQVFEMIRAETEYKQIPIFFLTGKNDRESVQKLVVLKPEGYLLKSMPPREIVKTIDEFFKKKKGDLWK